jgi:hypothetical protein
MTKAAPVDDPLISADRETSGLFVIEMIMQGSLEPTDSESIAAALRVAVDLDRIMTVSQMMRRQTRRATVLPRAKSNPSRIRRPHDSHQAS